MIDTDAFTDFYTSEHDRVYAAVAVTVGDLVSAKQATDEGFMRAAAKWRKVRLMDHRAGWVYAAAVAWGASRRHTGRRGQRTRTAEPLEAQQAARFPDPELMIELAGQPLQLRQLLILHHGFGLSPSEIAEEMGFAEETVRRGLLRGGERIAASLEADDGPR